MTERLRGQLSAPVDIAWLAGLRVLFGAAMSVSMLRFIANGWIDGFFVRPAFHFKYWPFLWIEPLSATGMHALFWALLALSLCFTMGLFFRVAGSLFVMGFTYLQLVDVTNYLNHYYLASLLAALLTLSPAHRAFSLDVKRTPALRLQSIPTFWLWLFRFQMGVVYTFAGFAKANPDWLLHAQPLRIWLGSRTDTPVLGGLFRIPWVPYAMSWAGFLFDTFVTWFLLIRRTRRYAYAGVLVFHGLTSFLFPIGMFPILMILGATVFFEPSWPLALARRDARRSDTRSLRSQTTLSTGMLAAAAAYCVMQVAFPLRHLAYGGDVRWHEQGMRFSWRVMVREKNGSVTFYVMQKRTGRTWVVSPKDYLSLRQEREMSGQPDLILQFAHYLRADFEGRGLGPVEVRAEALVSLNGRRMRSMIDPRRDLSRIDDGFSRASYILPGPSEPPPHIRPI